MSTWRFVLLAYVSFALVVPVPPAAEAHLPGDAVVFLVPFGTAITPAPGKAVAIIDGGSSFLTDVFGCAFDGLPRPAQSGAIVDPAAMRVTPIGEAIIPLATNGFPQTTPLPEGLRLGDLVRLEDCAESFTKYRGIVE